MNRLIIDASSIVRAAHYAGKDGEFGRNVTFEGKKVWVNSAAHCYENFLVAYRALLRQLNMTPRQTVLVLDGKDSRALRRSIYAEYKGKRAASPPELNAAYNEALEGIADEITAYGGLVVWQDYMEADDVIAYLAQNLAGHKTIWSRDADMLALHRPDVDVYLKDTMNPPIHDHCPAEYITVYKAVVGDPSDNLPGAKGFGPKAFTDMIMTFGYDALESLKGLIEDRQLEQLAEDVPQLKSLQKIIDNAREVYISYACAKFYPQRVNVANSPLKVKAQTLRLRDHETHELMAEFAGTKTLATSKADLVALLPRLKESPLVALDIETSTPAESDVWVARILASRKGNKKEIVDVFGSKLTGLALTFGKNLQHTVYVPVDHKDSQNLTSNDVLELVAEIPEGIDVAIHNSAFELPVLYNEWGCWIEGACDTALMCSHVDENEPLGLKPNSKRYLDYEQVSYQEVTTKEFPEGQGVGGKVIEVFAKEIQPAEYEDRIDEETGEVVQVGIKPAIVEPWERRQYKMNELTAAEVFDYGCDDTICTAALYNRLRFTMELEHTWEPFRLIELPAQYWNAQTFVDGIEIDWAELTRLEKEDEVTFAEQWEVVKDYLKRIEWPGTFYEPFKRSVAAVKDAFLLVTGNKLDTMVRKEEKLLAEVENQGAPELAEALRQGDAAVDEYLGQFFTGEPAFDVSKDAHLRELMYEKMKCPIRFRTRPTDNMRAKGIHEGTPQADVSAVDHAIALDLPEGSEEVKILKAVRTMRECLTRKELYYGPYPLLAHWKDNRLHPNPGQSRTATRRQAPNNPNLAQVPKRGDGKKVRKVYIAPKGWGWLSMDWSGQELRLAAERSGDVALTSCYVGENLRDAHTLTAVGIEEKRGTEYADYDKFEALRAEDDPYVKKCRDKAKSVNFSSQYLCRAPKLAKLLIVPVEEAEIFLDAKNKVYSGLAAWQQSTIAKAHAQGYVTTMMGARRHLHHKLTDVNSWIVNEAERQAVNFEIQGSGAEMMKLSHNRMAERGLIMAEGASAKLMFPVHDESDLLVRLDVAHEVIPALHACMVQQYADMKIPLESEIKFGPSFGELYMVGVNPDPEKIAAAVEKIKEVQSGKAA